MRVFRTTEKPRYMISNIENNTITISVTIKPIWLAAALQGKLRCWKSFIEFSFRYHKDVDVSTNHG